MKERPILFSAPMVRALLNCTKTQTRRVVKGNPTRVQWNSIVVDGYGGWCDEHGRPIPCPYGKPGDRLWVRETFCLENTRDYHGDHDIPVDDRPVHRHEDADDNFWIIPHYRATEPEPHIVPYRCDADDDKTRWTPSIFMPHWAARIILEIIDIRVERLNDISESDALAEGVTVMPCKPSWAERMGRNGFKKLWESINGTNSWDVNPLVWVIEFRKVDHVA